MKRNESIVTRLWAFALGVAVIVAAVLVMRINTFEISLAYMGILAAVLAVGLATNLWGGLAASAVAVFVITLINQYAGIYPRENRIINIASELILFLAVGPLAGVLASAVAAMQRQAESWLAQAEEQTIHDAEFGTLKPEWLRARLEEESLRAGRYNRPLAVAILHLEANAEAQGGAKAPARRAERLGALQAVVRVARSVTQPPAVVAYLGSDQVALILPEHTAAQARQCVAEIERLAETTVFFPSEFLLRGGRGAPLQDKSMGRPLGEWGRLSSGVAELDGQSSAEALLERAKAGLAQPNTAPAGEALHV